MKTMQVILVAFFCYLATAYGQTDLPAIARNAHFQYKMAKIALHQQVFGAEGVEQGLAKTDEEKACITNVKKEALVEGDTLLNETVGKIIPEVDQLFESQDEAAIKAFLEKTDYPAYKKSAMDECKKRLKTWVPAIQKRMAACRV